MGRGPPVRAGMPPGRPGPAGGAGRVRPPMPGGGGMGLPVSERGGGGGGMGLPDTEVGGVAGVAGASGRGGADGGAADATGAAGGALGAGAGAGGRAGATGAGGETIPVRGRVPPLRTPGRAGAEPLERTAGGALGAGAAAAGGCAAGADSAGAGATGAAAAGAAGVGAGVGVGAGATSGAGAGVATGLATGLGAGAGAGSALGSGAGSGSGSRMSPSRSALRRTRSAWASSMLDECVFTAMPRSMLRSRVSLLERPSSLASSWTRIFAANVCSPALSGLLPGSVRRRGVNGLLVSRSRWSGHEVVDRAQEPGWSEIDACSSLVAAAVIGARNDRAKPPRRMA
jgi:hypothetical protein